MRLRGVWENVLSTIEKFLLLKQFLFSVGDTDSSDALLSLRKNVMYYVCILIENVIGKIHTLPRSNNTCNEN